MFRDRRRHLVPTRVGMMMNDYRTSGANRPCPHTRGDDPSKQKAMVMRRILSPHAWDVPYIFVLCFNTSRPQASSNEPISLSSCGNFSHLLLPVFSSILLFCIFQQLFFCTHNRISQKYPPYRMSGKEGKNRYYNGVNVFFEYITLYLRGVPE